MRRFKYLWVVFLVVIAGGLLILRARPRDEKLDEHAKVIEEINARYYKLADLKVKDIVFWYESGSMAELAGQTGDEALTLAVKKAKFLVHWRHGKKLTVTVEGISRQIDAAAGDSIKRIISGVSAKTNELFQTISPAIDSLIENRRGVMMSFKKSDSRTVLEVSGSVKSESVKKLMYFNKDNMLLKTEVYRNGKLAVIDKMIFDLYDSKYILRKIRRNVITNNKGMNTEIDVAYADNKGLYMPSFIHVKMMEGDRTIEDGELSIVSLELMK